MKIFLISIITFLTCFLKVNFVTLKSNSEIEKLRNKIIEVIDQTEGVFAVAFSEIGNENNSIIINGDEIFHAASTMKTPVMIEVFRQASNGKFSINDSLLVKNEFRSIVDGTIFSIDVKDDGDDKLYSLLGKKQRIYDLVYDMITVSSNLATNLLIDLVGAHNVTETMKNFGLNNIKVLRGVEDIKAFEKGLNNTVNATDLMKLYFLIAKKEILSQKDSDEIIKILVDQKFKNKIPRYLPDNLKVAHKTGSITGIEHDGGIVFLPDGRKYILVVLSKNLKDSEEGKKTIGKISKLIYDYLNN